MCTCYSTSSHRYTFSTGTSEPVHGAHIVQAVFRFLCSVPDPEPNSDVRWPYEMLESRSGVYCMRRQSVLFEHSMSTSSTSVSTCPLCRAALEWPWCGSVCTVEKRSKGGSKPCDTVLAISTWQSTPPPPFPRPCVCNL